MADDSVADDYGTRHMGADAALFFERQAAPPSTMLGLAALGVLGPAWTAYAIGLSERPVVALVVAAFLAAFVGGMALLLRVARTVVTKDHVRMENGLAGPRIAISQIAHVEVVPFERRLGSEFDERIMSSPASTEMVKITYAEGGKRRVLRLGTQRAAALKDAIDRARGSSMPRVRVEAPTDPVDPDLAAAEAEVEALTGSSADRDARSARRA